MFVLRVLIGAWFAFFASLALCLAQQQSLETELSAIASDLPSGSPSGSASGSFSSDFSDQGFPSYSRSDMASYADLGAIDTPRSFVGGAFSETDALSMGLNFNEFPKDYRNGLLITKGRWAVKFGGYVKADLIHDRDPIDAKRTAKVPCFWIRPDSIVLPAYGGWVGTHAIQPSRQDRVLLCVEGDLIEWKLH